MAVETKRITVEEFDEFLARPENRERLFELIDGEIFEKLPTELHGAIAARLTIRLGVFIEDNDLGRITVEPRHQMPYEKHHSYLPDVAFTSNERALPIVEKGSVPQMPDLAIEIKSPDDSYTQMREKANYYIKNGSLLVWLVYPEKKFIEVYQPGKDIEFLNLEDTLNGGDVLPGFTLPVKNVFAVANK